MAGKGNPCDVRKSVRPMRAGFLGAIGVLTGPSGRQDRG